MVACSKKTKVNCIEDPDCKWIVGYGCVNTHKDESTLKISLRNKRQSQNNTSPVAKMSSPPVAKKSSSSVEKNGEDDGSVLPVLFSNRMGSRLSERFTLFDKIVKVVKNIRNSQNNTSHVAKMTSPSVAKKSSSSVEKNAASDGSVSPVLSSHSMGRLSERFTLFDKIVKVVKNIKKSCINFNTEKPNVQDIIVFDKLIGTPSTFGINYLTKINGRKICCKIQASGSMANIENVFLKNLTIIAKRNNYQHFPLLYHTISCSTQPEITDRLPELFKNLRKNQGYVMSLNEIASGDLKSFIYSQHMNEETWVNAIEQIIMALACFHSTGHLHQDSHFGNFLFHKITPGGCFEYIINGEKYYIKNIGFLWVIWDFGVSGLIWRTYDFVKDYNMLTLYMRKDDKSKVTDNFKMKYKMDAIITDATGKTKSVKGGAHRNWGNIHDALNIPKKITNIADKIWSETGNDKETSKYSQQNLTENKFLENLGIFSKTPIGDVKNSMIINFQETDDILLDKSQFPFRINLLGK
jgi:hypothetical protein